MRPPEFTGGNAVVLKAPTMQRGVRTASMRPPEFTGGNASGVWFVGSSFGRGIHRPSLASQTPSPSWASMRPPEFTGGNSMKKLKIDPASMRPPVTGGNYRYVTKRQRSVGRFNEAAGIHRRKPTGASVDHRRRTADDASMRPPEFTGGNLRIINGTRSHRQSSCSLQ